HTRNEGVGRHAPGGGNVVKADIKFACRCRLAALHSLIRARSVPEQARVACESIALVYSEGRGREIEPAEWTALIIRGGNQVDIVGGGIVVRGSDWQPLILRQWPTRNPFGVLLVVTPHPIGVIVMIQWC